MDPGAKDPPPSYSKVGYTTLPPSEPAAYYAGQSEGAYQYKPPNTGYAGYPQSAGYAPAPPVMQQSSVNTVSW